MTEGDTWVIATVGAATLALDAEWVTEMIRVPDQLEPVPGAPAHVRGCATLRGHTVTIIDARCRLGLESLGRENEALATLLEERERDHVRWLEELESCVRDGRAFSLALDPAECAFGRWHARYQAPNLQLERHLRRFEEPHRQIHALGGAVLELARKGQQEEALARIATARAGTLRSLVALFGEARRIVRDASREIVVLHVGEDEGAVGLAVDGVQSVEPLDLESFQPRDDAAPGVRGTVRTARGDRLVLLTAAPELAA